MGGAADLETELAESRAREAALAEILAVISRTTADLEPVFETILRKTLELGHADTAAIQLRDGDVFRGVAGMGATAHEDELDKESARRGHDFIRPGTRTTLTGRVAAEGHTVHIPDIATDEEYDPWSRELPGVERTMLGVPLVRGREVIALGFGVGIATGYATLGRIGFEGRYDHGAIGNVVILAQRLSAEAKGGQVLLSQRVHAAVESDVETTEVGDLTLKGFTRPVPAFAAESVKVPTPARS